MLSDGLASYDLDNIEVAEKVMRRIGLESLIDRPYLQRLKDVRLLGTMKYVVRLQHQYSRYEHSLAVALLTLAAVQFLGLDSLPSKVAVIAALLHDVGHTAMSHGAEVFLLRRQSRYHEGHTQRIIAKLTKELELEGQSELVTLVKLAGDLLSGVLPTSQNRKFYDSNHTLMDDDIAILNSLTTGPMSIDMIEGVTRTARSIGLEHPDPYVLISSISREKRELMIATQAWPAVSDLFELERKNYEDYIYSELGMAAEAMLTRSLELTFPKVTPNTEDIEVQDINYNLMNDFLTWSDSRVILQIKNNKAANEIFQRLENNDLYMSLAQISPDTHSDILDFLGPSHDSSFENRKALVEKGLASHLKLESTHVISHSTIRKIFRFRGPEALKLFSEDDSFSAIHRRSYSEIRRQFGTKRTSRVFQDVFLPYHLNNIKPKLLDSFSLPQYESTNLSDQSHVQPLVSKRFSLGKEEKSGMVATPKEVVDFLISWAVRSSSDTVLDPACGDGTFLQGSWNRLVSLNASREALNQIIGIERQTGLWQEMNDLWRENVIRDDFFEILPQNNLQLVDVVVGNPPYIRAHRFKGKDRERALHAGNQPLQQLLGQSLKLSQSSNYWAPFLLHACAFLRPSGRLAMVLPTELLTADYAQPVRDFLLKRFRSLSFVLFKKRIFEEEQDALLLLADLSGAQGVYKTEIENLENLPDAISSMSLAPQLNNGWLANKWTVILTNQSILDLFGSLVAHEQAIPFGTIATIKIGLVTGDSKFFTLKPSEARKNRLSDKWLIPVLTKAKQIQGATFTLDDKDELKRNDIKHLLLRIPPDTDLSTDPDLQRYIDVGRLGGIHGLYKCRTRWPWYSVPYTPVPDMFLTYMSGKRCRLCLNEAQISSTNTIHQIFLGNRELVKACILSFYSSLTELSIELMGRVYGGGLLKLEPSDAKRLLLPNPKSLTDISPDKISNLLSRVDIALRTQQQNEAWEELDELILVQSLGLSRSECITLREESLRLQNRRMNR